MEIKPKHLYRTVDGSTVYMTDTRNTMYPHYGSVFRDGSWESLYYTAEGKSESPEHHGTENDLVEELCPCDFSRIGEQRRGEAEGTLTMIAQLDDVRVTVNIDGDVDLHSEESWLELEPYPAKDGPATMIINGEEWVRKESN